ncbi:unnamed protein product, partial [Medioppia subpectinata]
GYPLCILYNLLLADKPVIVKHLYYTSCGLFLCYFNYGIDTIHSVVNCLFVYIVLTYIGPKRSAIALNLTFCMTYLLWGYYVTQIGSEYSFTWTIPQCVLTLRLIALTFDVYDGHRNAKSLNSSPINSKKGNSQTDERRAINEDTAVAKIPTLFELLSHAYFPGSFLMGPQVKYNNYMKYIESNENFLPKCWLPGLKRLVVGLTYLAIYQIGSQYWPTQYMLSQEFEGVCIISGASYDKKSGSVYECSNVHVINFETATTFGGLIRSFNLTTNEFAAKYLFKRLKFMGSRMASHFFTLFFLALWHGWSTGYYVTFGMEFLIMKMEWEVRYL